MEKIPADCPQVEIQTGEITYTFPQGGWEDWGGKVAKGAIIEALERSNVGVHSDFTGRCDGPTSDTMERKAPICYRQRGDTIQVYAWGERAHEHIRLIAQHVRALWVPSREEGERINDSEKRYTIVPVRIGTCTFRQEIVGFPSKKVAESGAGWSEYETVSPIWPPKNAKYQRPKVGTPAHHAWMGSVIAGSIRELLAGAGLKEERVHVDLVRWKHVPAMRFERDRPGVREDCDGVHARFVTNALLPDGWPVGARGADGYGEIRRCL